MNMIEHLKTRHLQLDRYKTVHISESYTTFMCYNLSGQLCGYLRYNLNGSKDKQSDLTQNKYHLYVSKPLVCIWGLETLKYNDKYLFLVEGIFDAVRLHNLNLPAISVFSNDPKHLKNQINLLGVTRRIIPICEDKAGMKLAKYGDEYIDLGGTDLGDMSESEIYEIFKGYIK